MQGKTSTTLGVSSLLTVADPPLTPKIPYFSSFSLADGFEAVLVHGPPQPLCQVTADNDPDTTSFPLVPPPPHHHLPGRQPPLPIADAAMMTSSSPAPYPTSSVPTSRPPSPSSTSSPPPSLASSPSPLAALLASQCSPSMGTPSLATSRQPSAASGASPTSTSPAMPSADPPGPLLRFLPMSNASLLDESTATIEALACQAILRYLISQSKPSQPPAANGPHLLSSLAPSIFPTNSAAPAVMSSPNNPSRTTTGSPPPSCCLSTKPSH